MKLEEDAEFSFNDDMEDVYELFVDGESAVHDFVTCAREVLAVNSVGEATDGCHQLALWPSFTQLLLL